MNAKEQIRELLQELSFSVRGVCDVLMNHEERVQNLEVAVENELQFLGALTANVMDSRRRVLLEKHLASFRETFKVNRSEEAEP